MQEDNLYLRYLAKNHENRNIVTKEDIDIQRTKEFINKLTNKDINTMSSKHILKIIYDELIITDIITELINKI